MYSIDKQENGTFNLTKDGQHLGNFASLEDAEKAKAIAEGKSPEQTGTWVEDGAGLEYPEGTDDYHSGDEKLSGEARIDALCRFLRCSHGIHVPYDIAPKD
jgi:hypothetical protein